MTITEFLLARIAEDEADAKAAAEAKSSDWMMMREAVVGARWFAKDGWGMVFSADTVPSGAHEGDPLALWDDEGSRRLCPDPMAARHMARHDPARVLAECEAKRRIVGLHVVSRTMMPMRGFDQPDYEEPEDSCHVCDWVPTDSACDTIRLLAHPYADHPDYDEAWRP